MLKIGLTGGIGSGKSTAADCFAALGAPIVDADLIAHELTAPHTPLLASIVREFGAGLLDAEGRLQRARLREEVFTQIQRRRALEAILHPAIQREMQARVDALHAPYVVLVIPLLVESGLDTWVQRILVVDAPEPVQQARAALRDGVDPTRIADIMAAQASRRNRLAAADDIIYNAGDIEDLRDQVRVLHERYLVLASRCR